MIHSPEFTRTMLTRAKLIHVRARRKKTLSSFVFQLSIIYWKVKRERVVYYSFLWCNHILLDDRIWRIESFKIIHVVYSHFSKLESESLNHTYVQMHHDTQLFVRSKSSSHLSRSFSFYFSFFFTTSFDHRKLIDRETRLGNDRYSSLSKSYIPLDHKIIPLAIDDCSQDNRFT